MTLRRVIRAGVDRSYLGAVSGGDLAESPLLEK